MQKPVQDTPAPTEHSIPVLEEVARVDIRRTEQRTAVRIGVTELEEAVEALLIRQDATIDRVPVGRPVEAPPPVRRDGDTIVVPILEERLVVEKRLFLKEELRIRITEERQAETHTVRLRQEHAHIEAGGAAPATQQTPHAQERSMSYTNNDPTRLNQMEPHDTSLYDTARHDNEIVALYDTDAQARSAKDMLLQAGVSDRSIQLVSRDSSAATAADLNDEGVWGAIKSLFAPESDRTAYSHAIGRGHAMLIVRPTQEADRTMIVHTLEATNPVDFDARLEEWRQSGYDTSTPHQDYAGSTAFTAPAVPVATDPMGMGSQPAPIPAKAPGTQADLTSRPGTEDTLKVMEERLRVGKREVQSGAVRIRSYVVERPVEEQVRLREEQVHVDRRPVDRPADPADLAAFQERTIEARATSEEPVVSKEARVVEEIGLRKDVSERTETVRDTVRKTEVDVDDAGLDRTGLRDPKPMPPR